MPFCHTLLASKFLNAKADASNSVWVNRLQKNAKTKINKILSVANHTVIVASPPTDLFQARKWQPRL